MLQLGFVSAIMAEKSFEEVIDFASENKFACVELMCWPKGKAERRYAGITHIEVDALQDKSIAHIKNYCEKRKVQISGLGYYPNPLDPDEEKSAFYISHLKKVISAAARLGVKTVNTFIGADPAKNFSDNLKVFKQKWPPIVNYAENLGIRIGIENCPMLFTRDEWPGGKNLAYSPAIWDEIFSYIPSANLGLNYDPSHLVWMHMDHIQPLYDYKDKLFHIHLKDVKIYKDKLSRNGILATPLEYHSPKIPGLGDVRWGDFFSALTTVGYKGPVCIEVEDKAYENSTADKKTALLTSRNYLSQYLVLES
ncbi:MAG: sugar phosphate isomerase/epimerase [Cyclobacteriaceae bacterium]|nr:sugar phosphate isomerase/epimerase [Cyclobacteriaceae bacterium]